jgi:molybdate transport system substrate-binding protein
MKPVKRLLVLIMALVMVGGLVAGCGKSDNDAKETTTEEAAPVTLNVFIAASLKNAMTEVQEAYNEEHPNVTIVYNPDSSGTLETQIKEGAECDMFFSAATKQMNELDEAGYITDDSIVNLLENKVVLIKAKGADTEVTDFKTVTKAANIALGAVGVPAGDYARQVFTNLGILDQVNAMQINEGKDVTAVLTAVSEGSNEVGVVYATDAQSIKDKVDIIAEAPEDSLDTPIIYPVGLVKNSKASEDQQKAAQDFLEFLQSDAAQKIFESYGFSMAE